MNSWGYLRFRAPYCSAFFTIQICQTRLALNILPRPHPPRGLRVGGSDSVTMGLSPALTAIGLRPPMRGPLASFSIDAEAFARQAAVDVMAKTIHLFVMVITLRRWSGR